MTKKYIDAEKLKKVIDILVDMPPNADVQEVKHGEWITKEPLPRTYGRSRAFCSRCGQFALYEFINVGSFGEKLTNYCPACGAKMDGKENNNG